MAFDTTIFDLMVFGLTLALAGVNMEKSQEGSTKLLKVFSDNSIDEHLGMRNSSRTDSILAEITVAT